MFSDTLKITNYPFNKVDIGLINNDSLARDAYPIVYILYDTKTMVAYVGESTNAIARMNPPYSKHPQMLAVLQKIK